MEMQISREWLQRRIQNDPDVETDAGTPIDVLKSLGMFLSPELVQPVGGRNERLPQSFGVLIRQLRRRDQLSVEQLSKKARIDQEELRQIEHDPHFRAKPRMVHQLSTVFKIPTRSMMVLSGAMVANDDQIGEEAERFAAKSDDLSKLTREELKLLNQFVKFLSDKVG